MTLTMAGVLVQHTVSMVKSTVIAVYSLQIFTWVCDDPLPEIKTRIG